MKRAAIALAVLSLAACDAGGPVVVDAGAVGSGGSSVASSVVASVGSGGNVNAGASTSSTASSGGAVGSGGGVGGSTAVCDSELAVCPTGYFTSCTDADTTIQCCPTGGGPPVDACAQEFGILSYSCPTKCGLPPLMCAYPTDGSEPECCTPLYCTPPDPVVPCTAAMVHNCVVFPADPIVICGPFAKPNASCVNGGMVGATNIWCCQNP